MSDYSNRVVIVSGRPVDVLVKNLRGFGSDEVLRRVLVSAVWADTREELDDASLQVVRASIR